MANGHLNISSVTGNLQGLEVDLRTLVSEMEANETIVVTIRKEGPTRTITDGPGRGKKTAVVTYCVKEGGVANELQRNP